MSQRLLLVALLVLIVLSAGFAFMYIRSKESESSQTGSATIPTQSESQTQNTPTTAPRPLIGVLCGPGKNGGPNICPDGYFCDNIATRSGGMQFPGTCRLTRPD